MKRTLISKRRWLLLPIDTKAREFYAKVLLSCIAAERGWGVLFGKGSVIRKKQVLLPRGTYLDKSISPGRYKDIALANKNGNRVSSWCEEGLLYLGREDYRQRRLETKSFESVDFFFAWGNRQAEDIRWAVDGGHSKIILSGNPRFDLLRPEYRDIYSSKAKAISDHYGKIILINTKFAMCNNNLGPVDIIEHYRSRGKIRDKEQEALMRRVLEYQKVTFAKFISVIPRIAREFRDYKVVIRTHPAESANPWNEIASSLPNVIVNDVGNVNEWMYAASAIVQNNCTTAVEGFLLERPVISYRPIQDEAVEASLVNQLGWQALNEDALINMIRKVLTGDLIMDEYERDKQMRIAKSFIANIDGRSASDIILDELEKLNLPLHEGKFPIRKSLKDRLRRYKRFIYNPRGKYLKKKYPGIDIGEIRNLMSEFSAITGRFEDVKVISVGDNGFCFYLNKK